MICFPHVLEITLFLNLYLTNIKKYNLMLYFWLGHGFPNFSIPIPTKICLHVILRKNAYNFILFSVNLAKHFCWFPIYTWVTNQNSFFFTIKFVKIYNNNALFLKYNDNITTPAITNIKYMQLPILCCVT